MPGEEQAGGSAGGSTQCGGQPHKQHAAAQLRFWSPSARGVVGIGGGSSTGSPVTAAAATYHRHLPRAVGLAALRVRQVAGGAALSAAGDLGAAAAPAVAAVARAVDVYFIQSVVCCERGYSGSGCLFPRAAGGYMSVTCCKRR